MTNLSELIERVRQATGLDRDVDWRIAMAFDIPEPWQHTAPWPPFAPKSKFEKSIPAFTASVDAALALVERCLPGWRYDLHSPRMGQVFEAVLMDGDSASRRIVVAHAVSAPLAIILALLLALDPQS